MERKGVPLWRTGGRAGELAAVACKKTGEGEAPQRRAMVGRK